MCNCVRVYFYGFLISREVFQYVDVKSRPGLSGQGQYVLSRKYCEDPLLMLHFAMGMDKKGVHI